MVLSSKEKRERAGWTWNETSSGGYWIRMKSEAKHDHKLDFFCPHCKRPTGTVDDDHLREYGICSVCCVMYVESRQTPTIDLSKYKKI